MGNFRQVTLYGIRTPLGEDILEGMDIICKTRQGQELCGKLESADSYTCSIHTHDGKIIRLPYDDISGLVTDD